MTKAKVGGSTGTDRQLDRFPGRLAVQRRRDSYRLFRLYAQNTRTVHAPRRQLAREHSTRAQHLFWPICASFVSPQNPTPDFQLIVRALQVAEIPHEV